MNSGSPVDIYRAVPSGPLRPGMLTQEPITMPSKLIGSTSYNSSPVGSYESAQNGRYTNLPQDVLVYRNNVAKTFQDDIIFCPRPFLTEEEQYTSGIYYEQWQQMHAQLNHNQHSKPRFNPYSSQSFNPTI